jgi:hypothetical protein
VPLSLVVVWRAIAQEGNRLELLQPVLKKITITMLISTETSKLAFDSCVQGMTLDMRYGGAVT